MSLDNQRNLKLAFERADVFMTAAEQVAGEMNAWAQGFLGRPIITDWRSQLDFTTRIFRPRGLHLDDRHVEHATGESLSASIVDLALYVGGNHARLRSEGRSVVLYLPKIQTAEEAALWTDMLDALERPSRPAARDDQGLRARRAARSLVPAHGDPRGARSALRRLQHRSLGLHQQRVGRVLVGPDVREPEHRRDHDDLRLHAGLRGSRAPRREHTRSPRALRPLAGRHGAEHPRRLTGWRPGQHGPRGRRRRARAARRRQRQVGRALEDGAHRPAGVGEGGQRESAGPRLSAADVHAVGCRRDSFSWSPPRARSAARAI